MEVGSLVVEISASDLALSLVDLDFARSVLTIWWVAKALFEPATDGEVVVVGERTGSLAFLISAPVKPVKPSLASVAAISLAWPR